MLGNEARTQCHLVTSSDVTTFDLPLGSSRWSYQQPATQVQRTTQVQRPCNTTCPAYQHPYPTFPIVLAAA